MPSARIFILYFITKVGLGSLGSNILDGDNGIESCFRRYDFVWKRSDLIGPAQHVNRHKDLALAIVADDGVITFRIAVGNKTHPEMTSFAVVGEVKHIHRFYLGF